MHRVILLYNSQVPPSDVSSGSPKLHYFLNGIPKLYQDKLARHDYTTYEQADPIIWRFHTARHPDLYAIYS